MCLEADTEADEDHGSQKQSAVGAPGCSISNNSNIILSTIYSVLVVILLLMKTVIVIDMLLTMSMLTIINITSSTKVICNML